MRCRFAQTARSLPHHPVEPHIVEAIGEKLAAVEREHAVTILFACESGSRAWGFASPDSDYDVRFIYVHQNPWYLRVTPGRDVIEETPGPVFDVSGWELRKALALLKKGNAVLPEWLDSPIIYAADPVFTESLRQEIRAWHRPVTTLWHYLRMAQSNHREFLQGETVRTKKYFYVLRPVLACRWIEQGLGPVPMRFESLLDQACPGGALRAAIDELLERKIAGDELASGPRIPVISDFLTAEIERFAPVAVEAAALQPPDAASLDTLLAETVLRFS